MFGFGCACVCMNRKDACKAAQRRQRGVIERRGVSDTVAVAAILNVLLIRQERLLLSLEEDEKTLPAVQSPTKSSKHTLIAQKGLRFQTEGLILSME